MSPRFRLSRRGADLCAARGTRAGSAAGHSGGKCPTLDVEAILARKPRACFVDALATNNPTGSRHEFRWQDVEEIVNAGIAVITSINLQHIARKNSRKWNVHHGTPRFGDRPQKFSCTWRTRNRRRRRSFRSAGSERVGASSDDLQHSRVLSELREMALLLTAEIVDPSTGSLLARPRHRPSLGHAGTHPGLLDGARRRGPPRSPADAATPTRFRGSLLALHVHQEGLRRTIQARIEQSMERRSRPARKSTPSRRPTREKIPVEADSQLRAPIA